MLDTLLDFVPLMVVVFLSFVIITVIETFVMKALKRLESPKNLYYAIAANVAGFLITLVIGGFILFAFIALLSTALGGAFWLMLISGILLVLLIASIPLLIFIARFFLLKSFGITQETRFRIIYSIASTIGVIIAIFIVQFVVSLVIFYIFPDFAV